MGLDQSFHLISDYPYTADDRDAARMTPAVYNFRKNYRLHNFMFEHGRHIGEADEQMRYVTEPTLRILATTTALEGSGLPPGDPDDDEGHYDRWEIYSAASFLHHMVSQHRWHVIYAFG